MLRLSGAGGSGGVTMGLQLLVAGLSLQGIGLQIEENRQPRGLQSTPDLGAGERLWSALDITRVSLILSEE